MITWIEKIRLRGSGKKIAQMVCVVLAAAMIFTMAWAAEEEIEDKEIVHSKTISGELTTASPQFLGLIYERDIRTRSEHEIMFLLDSATEFIRKERQELKPGDEIYVKYDEYFELVEDERGKKREKFVKRLATEVRFSRAGGQEKLVGRER